MSTSTTKGENTSNTSNTSGTVHSASGILVLQTNESTSELLEGGGIDGSEGGGIDGSEEIEVWRESEKKDKVNEVAVAVEVEVEGEVAGFVMVDNTISSLSAFPTTVSDISGRDRASSTSTSSTSTSTTSDSGSLQYFLQRKSQSQSINILDVEIPETVSSTVSNNSTSRTHSHSHSHSLSDSMSMSADNIKDKDKKHAIGNGEGGVLVAPSTVEVDEDGTISGPLVAPLPLTRAGGINIREIGGIGKQPILAQSQSQSQSQPQSFQLETQTEQSQARAQPQPQTHTHTQPQTQTHFSQHDRSPAEVLLSALPQLSRRGGGLGGAARSRSINVTPSAPEDSPPPTNGGVNRSIHLINRSTTRSTQSIHQPHQPHVSVPPLAKTAKAAKAVVGIMGIGIGPGTQTGTGIGPGTQTGTGIGPGIMGIGIGVGVPAAAIAIETGHPEGGRTYQQLASPGYSAKARRATGMVHAVLQPLPVNSGTCRVRVL